MMLRSSRCVSLSAPARSTSITGSSKSRATITRSFRWAVTITGVVGDVLVLSGRDVVVLLLVVDVNVYAIVVVLLVDLR